MSIVESDLVPLHIPQVAALATSACPAWLWSADGTDVLWANAAGAALFAVGGIAAIRKSVPGSHAALAAQIARLAATLPAAGRERLERLRGIGLGVGRTLTCACARLTMADRKSVILVAAIEPAGTLLPLQERIRRLFDAAEPVAAFAADGALLYAGAAAQRQFGGAASLSALGLESLAAQAFAHGPVRGTLRLADAAVAITAIPLGQDDARALVIVLPAPGDQPANALAEAPQRSAAPTGPDPTIPSSRLSQDDETVERRHPLRFVWHMDAAGRFAVGSDEFVELVGPRTIAACGRPWREIAAELKLDPADDVARAIATRETWSGISVSWPVDDSSERLRVELSGLPVFDHDRSFCGYRGFGVCRDITRISELVSTRRLKPIGFAALAQGSNAHGLPEPTAPQSPTSGAASGAEPASSVAEAARRAEPGREPAPSEAIIPHPRAPANVVPFRAGLAPDSRSPSLSPVESSAFRELAQELTARLRGAQPEAADTVPEIVPEIGSAMVHAAADMPASAAAARAPKQGVEPPQSDGGERMLLDRVPAGVLVYRSDMPLYANRYFLALTGYDSLEALAAAGGLNALFAAPGTDALAEATEARKLSIATRRGGRVAVESRLFSLAWNGTPALALVLSVAQAEDCLDTTQSALAAAQEELRELHAQFARVAQDEAQKAAAAKADFLAKISQQIRTPLNSMIGFAEVILAERFGAIGNARYREYLKDMHAAGTHLLSLLGDLLDLLRIEAGQFGLTFAAIDLNGLTQQCVETMQPQANRARIIIRSALASGLPPVTADARALRQMLLNLLASAIGLTGPAGQVIVSSAVADGGVAVLRVRDTGAGLRDSDIGTAFDPPQQAEAATGWGSEVHSLALPLAKALAEANGATFNIKSAPNAGTLVEITFPPRAAAH